MYAATHRTCTLAATLGRTARVPIAKRPGISPFHGGNTSSNLVEDAYIGHLQYLGYARILTGSTFMVHKLTAASHGRTLEQLAAETLEKELELSESSTAVDGSYGLIQKPTAPIRVREQSSDCA